eukprot:gb/GECG01010817.1/.p1 GENE.gb/GECG01010817.1/~~gb/GECG01010817.1/.p1  ORF type:complete len:813 (+),score=104.98 gb/GECG01010817.1/:1-2439(+)
MVMSAQEQEKQPEYGEKREAMVLEEPGPTVYEAFNELSQYFIGRKEPVAREDDEEIEEPAGTASAEGSSEQVGRKRARSETGEDTEADKTSTIGQTLTKGGGTRESDAFLQAVNQLREAVVDINELGQLLQSAHYHGMMTLDVADTAPISRETKALMFASNFTRMERTLKEACQRTRKRREGLRQRVASSRARMQQQSKLVESQVLLSYMDVHDLFATFQHPSKVDLNDLLERYARCLRTGLRKQEDHESLVHFRKTVQNLHTRAIAAKNHSENVLGVAREKQLFFKLSNPDERTFYEKRWKRRPEKKRSSIPVLLSHVRRAYILCNLHEEEDINQIVTSVSRRKRNIQEQRELCRQRKLSPVFPNEDFEMFLRSGVHGGQSTTKTTDLFAVPLVTTHTTMSRSFQLTLHRLPVWSVCRVFENDSTAGVMDTSMCLGNIFDLFRRSSATHLSRAQQKSMSSFEEYLKKQDDLFGFGMRATFLAAGKPCHGSVSLNNKNEFLEEKDRLSALSQWLLRSYGVLCILKEHLSASAALPIHDAYKIGDKKYLVDEGMIVADSLNMYSQAESRRQRLTPPHQIEVSIEPEASVSPQSLVFQFPFGRSENMSPLEVKLTLYPVLLSKGDASEASWEAGSASGFSHFGPSWFEYTRQLRKSILSDHPPFPQVDGASEPEHLPSLYFFLEPVRTALVSLRTSVEKEYISRALTSVGSLAFSLDIPSQLSLYWSFPKTLVDGFEGSCLVAGICLIALLHPCAVVLLEGSNPEATSEGASTADVSSRLDELLKQGAAIKHHYYINDSVYEAFAGHRKSNSSS